MEAALLVYRCMCDSNGSGRVVSCKGGQALASTPAVGSFSFFFVASSSPAVGWKPFFCCLYLASTPSCNVVNEHVMSICHSEKKILSG